MSIQLEVSQEFPVLVLEPAVPTTSPVDVTPALRGEPGPVGPEGPTGPAPDMSTVFQVSNRFYEIAEDEVAKATARSNLGLAVIDGGTFN